VRAVSTQIIIITKKNSTLIYVFNSIKSTLNPSHKIYNYLYPENVTGFDIALSLADERVSKWPPLRVVRTAQKPYS
jgi:hypothetical protein